MPTCWYLSFKHFVNMRRGRWCRYSCSQAADSNSLWLKNYGKFHLVNNMDENQNTCTSSVSFYSLHFPLWEVSHYLLHFFFGQWTLSISLLPNGSLFFLLSISFFSKNCLGVREMRSVASKKKRRKYFVSQINCDQEFSKLTRKLVWSLLYGNPSSILNLREERTLGNSSPGILEYLRKNSYD